MPPSRCVPIPTPPTSSPPTGHRWRAHLHFAPILVFLGLASAASLALLVGRRLLFGETAFLFLLWNLVLAWMPVAGAIGATVAGVVARPGSGRHRAWLVGCVAVWFFFFPNAPYLVTDLIHFRHRAPVPVWFDLLLLCSFAWLGVLLGFFALQTMQRLIASHCGILAGWASATVMIALSCLGVFVGRFWRWNSHDLLLPHRLWHKLSENNDVISPKHSLLFIFTFGVFSAIVFGGLYALTHHAHKHIPTPDDRRAVKDGSRGL
jgi:uncharacterized membrane protein